MKLGRYQILKQLATGSVADVLLARATGLEGFARHVVIKAIRPELAREERLVASFLEEARIAAALHHQNIVTVHDIGEQDGAYFFAMEYIHGEDVRKLLAVTRERNQQVPLGHVVAIVTSTAAGLHHAHEKSSPTGQHLGLVHRDVCPANILLGYDGSVKIVDFGMAKAALRSQKTATGSLKGKASYMSPEQCMGKPIDRRTDIFALGIVLYELATTQRLFKGANEFMTMAAIVEGEVPPPSAIRPELTKEFDEIVLRALARAPEARYQTAEDMRAALERYAVDQQLRTSNKALADYFLDLFGQRTEPWHAEAEPQVRSVDDTRGKGLVAAPEDNQLIARHAPRSTAPIMIAQTMAESEEAVDEGWSDEDEHISTAAKQRSQQLAAGTQQAPAVVDDDPFGRTLITPPVFADIDPPPTMELRDEDISQISVTTAPQVPIDVEDSQVIEPPTHHDVGEDSAITELPVERAVTDYDPPVRAQSEQVYVGPPAPRPSKLALAKTSFAKARTKVGEVLSALRGKASAFYAKQRPKIGPFFSTYRRSVIVGAGAGLLTVLLLVLAVRACKSKPAPAGDPALQDGGAADGGVRKRKKKTVTMPVGSADSGSGSGSAR